MLCGLLLLCLSASMCVFVSSVCFVCELLYAVVWLVCFMGLFVCVRVFCLECVCLCCLCFKM